MTKILVTGGNGFIAVHIIKQLLERGHTVVTTVRTKEKAAQLQAVFPDAGADKLQVVLTPDLTQPNAFDEVVRTPGIEVVLHTASPFHFRVTDPVKDLVEPAVKGTTSILQAIKAYAPQVRRVVVTSSFAAILDPRRVEDPTAVFSELSWNPLAVEDIQGDPGTGYRVSKKLAERAAWDFIVNEQPEFDLATVNPPMVYGPILHKLPRGIEDINTSNQRIAYAANGTWKKSGGPIPDTGVFSFVDVRDVAAVHVFAAERPEAGGHRLFATGGFYDNKQIVEIIRANFPEYADNLPSPDTPGGTTPAKHYGVDNSDTNKLLGIQWTSIEKSVVDAVKSLKEYL